MPKEIKLTQGYKALVDDEDFEYLSQFKWYISSRGYALHSAYDETGKKKPHVRMHRIVLERKLGRELVAGELPDHRDSNKLNNTRQNLRISTHQQNTRNRAKWKSSSRFKGVSWRKSVSRWYSTIRVNDKLIHLGSFLNEEEAARKYDEQALIHFGEFARLNFPIEV